MRESLSRRRHCCILKTLCLLIALIQINCKRLNADRNTKCTAMLNRNVSYIKVSEIKGELQIGDSPQK